MSAETLIPDALLAQTNLSGVVGDVDDDPDSPDGLWLIASGNNVSTDVRASFGTPTADPSVGADLQEFRALVRQFDEGQSGTPDARIELWESGALVRAGSDTAVPDGGIVLAFTWNANELATADGSLVELKVVGTKSGGSPGARNTVEVGAFEWNAEVSANIVVTPPAITVPVTGPVPTILVSDHQVVTPPAITVVVTGPAPMVTASDHQIVTPPVANIVVTGPAPTIVVGISVTPPAASVTITGPAPTILITDNKLVAPPTVTVVVTGPAPTVIASDHKIVTPLTITVVVTGPAPTIVVSSGGGVTVTPAPANIVLTGPAPHVAVASAARNVLLAHRLDAVAAPSVTDDSSMRYSIGSLWVDTVANLVYQCVDASAGAAVWRHLSSGGSPIPLGRCSVFDTVVFSGPNSGTVSSNGESLQRVPLPAAGRLTTFVMMVVIAPNAGVSVDVVMRLNGVNIAGTSFTFTDADAVGDVKTATFSEPVALGDLLSVRYTQSATSDAVFSSMAYWQGN